MNTPRQILLCTDASPASEQAADLLCQMRLPPEAILSLLGVNDPTEPTTDLAASFDRITKRLSPPTAEKRFAEIKRIVRQGAAAEQIKLETQDRAYDLVVIGERGRSRGFSLFKMGTTARTLARQISVPLLITRQNPPAIRRILFCTSAEVASQPTFERAAPLIANIKCSITVLHVMSQVTFNLPGEDKDLLSSAQAHIERQTREGKHFSWALNFLQQAGVAGQARPLLRQGLVLDEVKQEIEQSKIDLLVIGAHSRPGQSRLMSFLLENVAGELLTDVPCSVLIA